jgi:hypothetical protein
LELAAAVNHPILNAIGGEEDPATTAQPTPSATQATETVAAPPAGEPAPEPECDKLSKADLRAIKFIARDKKIDISAGVALPLPEEFNGLTLTWVIALDTADAGIPIFATDDDLIEFDQAFPHAGGFDHQVGAAKSSGS